MDTPRGKGKDTSIPGSPKTDNSALTKDNGKNSGNKLEIDGSGKTGKSVTQDLMTPPFTVDREVSGHGFHDGGNSDPETVNSSTENEGEEVQSQMAMVQIMPPHMSGQFISQQMNHPMQSGGIAFPSIEKVVEFRYDLVSMTQFQEHRIHDLAPYTSFNLAPSNRQVFVVVESCSHYYSQPSCMYIAGEWVPTTILIPVAQHICVSLDDGIKRYEEVIKVDLLKVAHPSEPHVGFLTSIEHRVVRGNPSHRPRFGDILRKSLMESMRQLSDMQFELLVSRPTGRNVGMDCRLTSFFNESRPGSPYELHVNPLIQHVPQHLEVPLAGVRYKLAGLFYRPFVGYASILLTRADIQIFETLALNVYTNDRKVVAVAFDSAMVRIVGNPDGSSGISLIDAASYSEFGPICSGLNVLSHNPRVPHSYHPFCNLSQNVIFNRALNPFHNFTFSPPISIPGHPPPQFFPAPYGYPFGCHMLSGLVQPFVQQPLFLPIPFPSVDCMDQQQQQINHDNGSHSDFDHRTPISSPRAKKTAGKESTTKLNPNARDFYPPGYHSLVATPFPVQTGPEEFNISDLQTESEDQVILSSSMPCPPLSVDELEVLQIHAPPAEKSCSSEISMLVNRTNGGFLNQSDSHCSLYDPDTSSEIRSSANPNQYSWSEQVENEEKTDNQAPRYDNRGGKIFRGGGYRGSGGYRSNQQEEWGGRGGNKYSNYRWNSRQHSRQDSGEPVDSNSQDVRLGHGFNNRTNFNQTRPTGGQFENDRGNWRYGRPRGGRGRGYGYPRYDQDHRRGYGNSNQNRNSGDWRSDPRPSQQGETNVVQKSGFCQEPRPESEPETPEVNHRGSSDSDDIPDRNRREKTPVSYAAAARTNVPEDQVQVPTKAQIFTATPTVKAESEKSHDDHENDFSHHNDGYKGSSPRRGYHNNAYKTVHRSEYRPTSADNKPNDNNTGFRPHSQNQTEYSQGEYNDQRQGVPFRKNYYNKYPQRETWNSEAGYSGETENTADTRSGPTSTYTPRGGRFQNYNNRYQRNFPVGKYSRRGSGRTPHNQDVPILTDFPPLGSASSKPHRDAKEPAKPTKASSRGTVKGRGKKFRNHHKDGSGSSDDFGKCDNYLSDVIPNENRPNRSQMSLKPGWEDKLEKPQIVESDDGEHQDEDKESEFDEIHDRFQTQSEEDDSKVELKQEWDERQTCDEKAIDNDREDPKDAQGDGFFQPEIEKECVEIGEMDLKVIDEQREKTVSIPVCKDSMENDVEMEGKNECQTDAEAGGEPRE